jgi:hypothetical protein
LLQISSPPLYRMLLATRISVPGGRPQLKLEIALPLDARLSAIVELRIVRVPSRL